MANTRIPTFDAGHRNATAIGTGLEFALIAIQHLLPDWLGAGLWWFLLLIGLILILWGVWPLLIRLIASIQVRLISVLMMVAGGALFLGGRFGTA